MRLKADRLTTGLKPSKFGRILAVLGLVLALSGCGPKYHLRRAQYHINKAEAKGAIWKRDTVWQEFKFTAPSVTNSLTVRWPRAVRDTVIMTKDSIQIKWFPKVVEKDTVVYVEIKCPEKDVEVKVPVAVDNTLKAHGLKWWWVLIGIVLGVLVGGLLVMKHYQRK